MQTSDKPQFAKLLADVMAGYGKPLPDGGTLDVWFRVLTPFAPAVIARAFAGYSMERPDHAPAPNSIAARCRLLDGRPDDNEAWAIALTTRGEAETVVWTEETRDAWIACQPVLLTGDEIGARMAFKDAYTRLVTAARAANLPANWVVSEGWDKTKKALVLAKAQRDGLLPAPPAHLALTHSGAAAYNDQPGDEKARAQLANIRRMLADSAAERQRRLERAEQERNGSEMARDIEIAQQVRQYQAAGKSAA